MHIGYCSHCLKTFVCGKDAFFNCQQCPDDFGVCDQCISLMPHEHPPMHIFAKGMSDSAYLKHAHDLTHPFITCQECQRDSFDGIRYQCEQCESSYDLCEQCIGKTHQHHTFKMIQNPSLRAGNNSILARRILEVVAKNTDAQNVNWHDPITGWTKADAENMIKQAKNEMEAYDTRKQEIFMLQQQRNNMILDNMRAQTAIIQSIMLRSYPRY